MDIDLIGYDSDIDIEALYDAIQGNAGVDTDESEDQGEEQLPVTENRHSHNNMDPALSPASTHQPCEGSRRDPPTTHTMAEGGDIASHNTHYSQTSAVEEIQRPPAVHLDVEDLRPAVDEGMEWKMNVSRLRFSRRKKMTKHQLYHQVSPKRKMQEEGRFTSTTTTKQHHGTNQ